MSGFSLDDFTSGSEDEERNASPHDDLSFLAAYSSDNEKKAEKKRNKNDDDFSHLRKYDDLKTKFGMISNRLPMGRLLDVKKGTDFLGRSHDWNRMEVEHLNKGSDTYGYSGVHSCDSFKWNSRSQPDKCDATVIDKDIMVRPKLTDDKSQRKLDEKIEEAEKLRREKEEKQREKAEKLRREKEEKQRDKDEKRREKEEKQREKEEKKKKADILKSFKPGECLRYVTIKIDSAILSWKCGGEFLTCLKSCEAAHAIANQPVPYSVTWTRTCKEDGSVREENELLLVWTWEELVKCVAHRNLKARIDDLQKREKRVVCIVVFEMEKYFRFQKTCQNREMKKAAVGDSRSGGVKESKNGRDLENAPSFSRVDVETALAEVQLLYGVSYRFVETANQLGLLVNQFTKAVSEIPFKTIKTKCNEDLDWYADSKNCVKVEEDGTGLLELWQRQLCEFPNVTSDVAQAIISEYNSPLALSLAYEKCCTEAEKKLLLQDIQIRRTYGPLSSTRRIGPELSKKVYRLFHCADGNTNISQDF